MKPGDHLVDVEQGKTAYRVEKLLAAGDLYQIAAAYDEFKERQVAVRALLYGGEASDIYITGRRSALKREWDFLQDVAPSGVAPEPIEWLEVEDSPVERPPEPLIVCERVDGPSLYDFVVEEHPEGIEPQKALNMMATLVDFLAVVHNKKWLWRDFDPRRFKVIDGDVVRAVSTGRIVKRGVALEEEQVEINADYVAPEVRGEMTGKMQRPAADLYGLGALMSFVLTGEEPRHRVESPLSYTAYERIQELDRPGLELLIARLLQPLAKKRIGRAERLRKYCDIENLPTREDKGFEMATLPAPWLGLDIEDPEKNLGLRSKLSSGPLVSVGRDTAPDQAPEDVESGEPKREIDWTMVGGLVTLVAIVVIIAAVMGM